MTTTEPKTKKASADEDLEHLLGEIGGDGQVAVSRKEPDWAKGHIRTVLTSKGDRISMDWITAKFGGDKLQIRVYGSDGRTMIGSRTVDVCAPPRNGHGIEIVRGPDGEKCLVTQLEVARRRYNQIHGIEEPAAALPPGIPAPAATPAQPFDMTSLFTAMIGQMNQTNQAMMTMLVNRITSLETMGPAQHGGAPPPAPPDAADPLGNLTNVVKVIGELDAVKEKMGISDREPQNEMSGYMDLIKGFMELHVEKQKAQVAQLQQAAAPAAQLPAGQPGGQPPPPPPQAGAAFPPGVPKPTAAQLLPLVKEILPEYLENASREERVQMASMVLGEPIYDDQDDGFEDEFAGAHDPPADPPEVENAFPDRQETENGLDLDIHDETGVEPEDTVESCMPPPTLEPPPASQPE